MLQREPPAEWIQAEIKSVADLNFRFEDKCEPSRYVTSVANNMQLYPAEHYITVSLPIPTACILYYYRHIHSIAM